MLPPSHVAYTWAALSTAQDLFKTKTDVDYRLIALAAMGPDLIDKPLALAYFYRRYRSGVLFAHTLLLNLLLIWWVVGRARRFWLYLLAFVGHLVLDRIWFYPDTFYWPLRGWRFHVWRKQGSEQEQMAKAYMVAFAKRRELWGWEVGGLLALAWFVYRHRLYRWSNLWLFLRTGRPAR